MDEDMVCGHAPHADCTEGQAARDPGDVRSCSQPSISIGIRRGEQVHGCASELRGCNDTRVTVAWLRVASRSRR